MDNVVKWPNMHERVEQKKTSYNLGNTELLELSKCRTKTYGLNYLKEPFSGINCQSILRKQNLL